MNTLTKSSTAYQVALAWLYEIEESQLNNDDQVLITIKDLKILCREAFNISKKKKRF